MQKKNEETSPADAEIAVLFERAAALQTAGRLRDAVDAYRRLLAVAPDLPEAVLNLATTLRALGEEAAAIKRYRQASALRPAWGAVYRLSGEALFAADRPAQAVVLWRRAVQLEPETEATLRDYIALARLYALFQTQVDRVFDTATEAGAESLTEAGAESLTEAGEKAAMRRNLAFKLVKLSDYFNRTVVTFGDTAQGLSIHDSAYHRDSLRQLVDLLPADGSAWTVNDLGCGYGAFFDAAESRLTSYGGGYYGYDISPAMVARARARIDDPRAVFAVSSIPLWTADYSVAAGIFNYNGDHEPEEWRAYMRGLLLMTARASRRAFAFNALRPTYGQMFRMAPDEIISFIRARITPNVTLIDDYSDIEWTIVARGPFASVENR